MPDELGPEDVRSVWRNQPVDPVRLSGSELRRKAELLEAKHRRGIRITAVLMSSAALAYALFLCLFPGSLQRVGSSLTLAGYVYCGIQLRRMRSAATQAEATASVTGAAYRAALERQREFALNAWRRLMLPVAPGPAVFVLGFLAPEQGFAAAMGVTAALIATPFVSAIVLGRAKARKLELEINELNGLLRQS